MTLAFYPPRKQQNDLLASQFRHGQSPASQEIQEGLSLWSSRKIGYSLSRTVSQVRIQTLNAQKEGTEKKESNRMNKMRSSAGVISGGVRRSDHSIHDKLAQTSSTVVHIDVRPTITS